MTDTVEERLTHLEDRVREMEERLRTSSVAVPTAKRGWRAFVGVDANNPGFEDAVRFGREWRFADSPKDDEDAR
jgi:transcription elongation GreA/GreB family factor